MKNQNTTIATAALAAVVSDVLFSRMGNNTNLTYTAKELTIELTEDGRVELLAELENKGEHFNDEDVLWELLEEHWTNGAIDSVRPEEVGALTDSLLLVQDAPRNDNGDLELEADAIVYWFSSYCINSYIEVLLKDGKIVFTSD